MQTFLFPFFPSFLIFLLSVLLSSFTMVSVWRPWPSCYSIFLNWFWTRSVIWEEKRKAPDFVTFNLTWCISIYSKPTSFVNSFAKNVYSVFVFFFNYQLSSLWFKKKCQRLQSCLSAWDLFTDKKLNVHKTHANPRSSPPPHQHEVHTT